MGSLDDIFKAYDIRGVVPDQLNAELAKKEAASPYAPRTTASKWTEAEMQAAFIAGPVRRPCCVCRLGTRLIAPSVQRLRDEIDPESQGGAYMLGLRQLGVVAHGRFGAHGFARAIEVAARGVEHDVIGRTRSALEAAGALRPPSSGSLPALADSSGPSETAATVPMP